MRRAAVVRPRAGTSVRQAARRKKRYLKLRSLRLVTYLRTMRTIEKSFTVVIQNSSLAELIWVTLIINHRDSHCASAVFLSRGPYR